MCMLMLHFVLFFSFLNSMLMLHMLQTYCNICPQLQCAYSHNSRPSPNLKQYLKSWWKFILILTRTITRPINFLVKPWNHLVFNRISKCYLHHHLASSFQKVNHCEQTPQEHLKDLLDPAWKEQEPKITVMY